MALTRSEDLELSALHRRRLLAPLPAESEERYLELRSRDRRDEPRVSEPLWRSPVAPWSERLRVEFQLG